MTYQTCNTCAAALVNCDLSGLEYLHGTEDMARIEASIESMGLVTLVDTKDPGGYFNCYVCGEICLGDMFTFERV